METYIQDLNRAAEIAVPNSMEGMGAHNFIYWIDDDMEEIHRASMDNTDTREVFITTGFRRLSGIEVDSTNEKVYWADAGHRIIYRANLDGTNAEEVICLSGGVVEKYIDFALNPGDNKNGKCNK